MLPFLAEWLNPTNASGSRPLQMLRAVWPGTTIAVLLLLGAFLHYAVRGLPGLPYFVDRPFLLGWESMATTLEATEEQLESQRGRPLVIGMDKYRIASGLAFYRTKAEAQKKGRAGGEAVL